ncbi:hypothetical protein [Solimonas marina]|uniref:Uncharacterized protein n=1 Tax=Solimonas marina TaxID=2714601 RepID=A0A969WEP6_9GAMM|nr:hypothetical protein [Solimonas marina]NKF24760.1 hypothetical protein [Solimonas marina]
MSRSSSRDPEPRERRAPAGAAAGRARTPAVEELAFVQRVTDKGFGFARTLTGTRREDIFLNESRIASLAGASVDLSGTPVRLQIVDKADGKRSAVQGHVLALEDASAAAQLWDVLATANQAGLDVTRLRELLPDTPVLLPLILAMQGALRDDLTPLRPLVAKLPTAVWAEPVLESVWPLATPAQRMAVMRALQQQADARLPAMLRIWMCEPFFVVGESMLGRLWETLPAHRALWLGLAQRLPVTSSGHISVGTTFAPRSERGTATTLDPALLWARRGIDQAGGDPARWWQRIVTALDSGASWPAEEDDWPALADAPSTVIRAMARQRAPRFCAALAALDQLGAWTQQQTQLDAEDVLQSLDDRDRALAELWVSTQPAVNAEMAAAIRAQMQTARAAEKAAQRYLQSLGLSVRDVAIEQLSSADSAWQAMDLQIDGRHGVDVKNCRRTLNGGMRSGRWKVKAFKADVAGRDVLLCGVSSPYTRFDDGVLTSRARRHAADSWRAALPGANEAMVVLGVTHAGEVQELLRRFRDVFHLHSPVRQRLMEMPVWAWDYPIAHYRARNESLQVLRAQIEAPATTAFDRRLRAELPPALWSFWDLDLPGDGTPWSLQQRAFLELLREQWRQSAARMKQPPPVPRLPWLYLFVLHAWLRWRASGQASDAGALASLLGTGDAKAGRAVSASTLGIADPAGSLDALLKALATLDAHLTPAEFQRIGEFTMYPNGILIGRFDDGMRRTLLAHCGGRVEAVMADCGYWPLVYGKDRSCSCGRLICPKCLCCSDSAQTPCPHQLERQQKSRERSSPAPAAVRRRSGFGLLRRGVFDPSE